MRQEEFGINLEEEIKCKEERADRHTTPLEETQQALKYKTHPRIINGST